MFSIRKRRVWFVIAFLAMLMVLPGAAIGGIYLDPRDAAPAPGGTDVIHSMFMLKSGNEWYKDGKKINNNTSVRATVLAMRYGHYGNVGNNENMRWYATAILPYGDQTVDGALVGYQQQSATGIADPTFMVAFWPYTNYKKNFHIAGAFWVTAPLGQYDNTKMVNMGTNTWTFHPQVAAIKLVGPVAIQLVGGAIFATDNSDATYGTYYHQTLQKDVLGYVEGAASFNLSKDLWFGTVVNWSYGGQTKYKEFPLSSLGPNNDRVNDLTVGLRFGYKLTQNWNVSFGTNYKAITNNGTNMDNILTTQLYYAW